MATEWQNYSTKAQKFDALVLKAKRLSEQIINGNQQSYFKGRGILFDEIRKYHVGDDVRAMHWNVTARLREPHIKIYREEKNLTLWLLIDVSGSGIFGTHKQTKLETILELCAVLGFAAVRSNCSIGAVYFSDKIEHVIFPKKGNSHCLKLLHFLKVSESKGKQTDITIGLDFILKAIPKGSMVVVLSDFLDKEYDSYIRVISQKHELLGIRVFDRLEAVFPPTSYMQVMDAETGREFSLQTSSINFQHHYTAWFRERSEYFKKSFEKAGAGALDIATDEIYFEKLLRYFQKR